MLEVFFSDKESIYHEAFIEMLAQEVVVIFCWGQLLRTITQELGNLFKRGGQGWGGLKADYVWSRILVLWDFQGSKPNKAKQMSPYFSK